jgi:hypothetical protein
MAAVPISMATVMAAIMTPVVAVAATSFGADCGNQQEQCYGDRCHN